MSSSIEIRESDDINNRIKENPLDDDEDEVVNKNEVILSNEDDENDKELKKNQKIVLDRLMTKLNPRCKYIINAYFRIGW